MIARRKIISGSAEPIFAPNDRYLFVDDRTLDFNWMPWQRPLRNQKRGPDRSSTKKVLKVTGIHVNFKSSVFNMV